MCTDDSGEDSWRPEELHYRSHTVGDTAVGEQTDEANSIFPSQQYPWEQTGPPHPEIEYQPQPFRKAIEEESMKDLVVQGRIGTKTEGSMTDEGLVKALFF